MHGEFSYRGRHCARFLKPVTAIRARDATAPAMVHVSKNSRSIAKIAFRINVYARSVATSWIVRAGPAHFLKFAATIALNTNPLSIRLIGTSRAKLVVPIAGGLNIPAAAGTSPLISVTHQNLTSLN